MKLRNYEICGFAVREIGIENKEARIKDTIKHFTT